MPFRSAKQRAYLKHHHPDIYRRWAAEHGTQVKKAEPVSTTVNRQVEDAVLRGEHEIGRRERNRRYRRVSDNVYVRPRRFGRNVQDAAIRQMTADSKAAGPDAPKVYTKVRYPGLLLGGQAQVHSKQRKSAIDVRPGLLPTRPNRNRARYISSHEHSHADRLSGQDYERKMARRALDESRKAGFKVDSRKSRDRRRAGGDVLSRLSRERGLEEGRADAGAMRRHRLSRPASGYPDYARFDTDFGAGYREGGGKMTAASARQIRAIGKADRTLVQLARDYEVSKAGIGAPVRAAAGRAGRKVRELSGIDDAIAAQRELKRQKARGWPATKARKKRNRAVANAAARTGGMAGAATAAAVGGAKVAPKVARAVGRGVQSRGGKAAVAGGTVAGAVRGARGAAGGGPLAPITVNVGTGAQAAAPAARRRLKLGLGTKLALGGAGTSGFLLTRRHLKNRNEQLKTEGKRKKLSYKQAKREATYKNRVRNMRLAEERAAHKRRMRAVKGGSRSQRRQIAAS